MLFGQRLNVIAFPLCAHGEYSGYLDSTFQTGLLGQAEKADGSVDLVRSPSCYSTVG